MHEFCTLFDRNYLPRGLVLYRSLVRTGSPFRLRVFCMDDDTFAILGRLELPGIELIALRELESLDPALAAVRSSRTHTEYCWTATPAVCRASFERDPALTSITYLDADLAFHADPAALFLEMGAASVAIVPHRYSPRWRHYEASSGIYNVEWLTFRNDDRGRTALGWWRDRCLEWCFARAEDGKFGDQKYLDDWPTRFEGVHVLGHPGAGVAPWNLDSVDLWHDPASGTLHVGETRVVFFHHHGLRLIGGPTAVRRTGLAVGAFYATADERGRTLTWASDYPVDDAARALIWDPYIGALSAESRLLEGFGPTARPNLAAASAREVAWVARYRARKAPARLGRMLARRRARRDWGDADVASQMIETARCDLASADLPATYRVFLDIVQEILGRPGLLLPLRLLDVGCGAGAYADLLERHVPERFSYAGWDSSAAVVAAATRARPGKPFAVASLLDRDIPGDFDVVLASAVIDVISEPLHAIDRLLAAPARFVIMHRQRIVTDATRIELAAGYFGQTTYRSSVTLADIERVAARHGRSVGRAHHVQENIFSLLLERVDDRR